MPRKTKINDFEKYFEYNENEFKSRCKIKNCDKTFNGHVL